MSWRVRPAVADGRQRKPLSDDLDFFIGTDVVAAAVVFAPRALVGQVPAEGFVSVLSDPVLEMLLASVMLAVVAVVADARERSVLRQEGGEKPVNVGLVLLALTVQTFEFVTQLPEASKAAFKDLLSSLQLLDSTLVFLLR